MQANFRIIKITFLSLLACVAYADSSQKISFSEAVTYALESNPRMMESISRIEAANAMITESRGEMLPRLNLGFEAARSNNPANVFSYKLAQGNVTFGDFGLSQFQGLQSVAAQVDSLDSPGYYNNFNTGVQVSVPIFKGGYNKAMLEKSRHRLSEAQHGNTAARNELIYDVLQAYESVLVSEKFVKIAKRSVNKANEFLELTQRLLSQSLITESDLYLAKTNLRTAETNLKAHLAQHETQLETFRILIGKQNSEYTPKEQTQVNLTNEPLKVFEERATLNNPGLMLLKSRIDAAQSDVSSSKAAYWPQIDLKLRQEWNDESFGLSKPAGSVFLDFAWELFNFGIRSGTIDQAIAGHRFAQAEYNKRSQDIQIALGQALRQAHTAELQLATANENKIETKKSIAIIEDRYGRGVEPLIRLIESQNRYDTYKAQEAVANYDIRLARARVLNLVNELKIDDN